MDIAAHALWAGLGVVALRRHIKLSRGAAWTTIALAVLPDLLQLIPVLAWSTVTSGHASAWGLYALASPGTEPLMPPAVNLWAHHLHCVPHSAVVAGSVTALLFLLLRRVWFPLLGWWSHILIDIFTHSEAYYPSPVLYPISLRGFDGIAWNTPWFMVLNYSVLGIVATWLFLSRRTSRR